MNFKKLSITVGTSLLVLGGTVVPAFAQQGNATPMVSGTPTTVNGVAYSYSPNYGTQLQMKANTYWLFDTLETHGIIFSLVQWDVKGTTTQANMTWSIGNDNNSFYYEADVKQSYTKVPDELNWGNAPAGSYEAYIQNNLTDPVSFNFYVYADPYAQYEYK